MTQQRFRQIAAARRLCGCVLLVMSGGSYADNSLKSLPIPSGRGADGIYLAVTAMGRPQEVADNRVPIASVNLPTGWATAVPLQVAAEVAVGNQPRPTRALAISAQFRF